ncbi:MAG: hdrA2 [Anaerolineaceae bacterium]|nr:MAG: hdrA2 [Anaerolineaceae bacterium]
MISSSRTSTKGPLRVGVYVCHCGTNIAATVDVAAVAEFAKRLEGVAIARDYTYMCSNPGQDLIKQDIAEHGLNRRAEPVLLPDGEHSRTLRVGGG